MKYLYWRLRSWAFLIWDCFTIGPRQAWKPYKQAKQIAKQINISQYNAGPEK